MLCNALKLQASIEAWTCLQVGVKQVIQGWDIGIAGNGADIPPMKVCKSRLPCGAC